MEKATCAPIVEVDSDEEAEMDIPPPTSTYTPSPPPPTIGASAGSSSALPDWYQNCLNALILCLLISSSCGKIIKMISAFYFRSKIDNYAPCLRNKIIELERSWLSKLTWHNSCDLSFILHCSSCSCLFYLDFCFGFRFVFP